MNREFKRQTEKQQKRDSKRDRRADAVAMQSKKKRERTGARQFMREVRGELKRVAWPSRKELTSYSLVVLVSVSLITLFIFGLDQLFGQFVLWIFG
ncbi:MAG TPA: preprotein translocase subunit SecE [Egibacteraceae bacterium]|nr:preprotein translocase subunit SecE [Egibacteraceae bacterium]